MQYDPSFSQSIARSQAAQSMRAKKPTKNTRKSSHEDEISLHSSINEMTPEEMEKLNSDLNRKAMETTNSRVGKDSNEVRGENHYRANSIISFGANVTPLKGTKAISSGMLSSVHSIYNEKSPTNSRKINLITPQNLVQAVKEKRSASIIHNFDNVKQL